jgi:CheY-like chemotaxis protein
MSTSAIGSVFDPWPLKTQMTPTILLIDDNAVQATTRQTILKRAGYDVISALSPQEALQQFPRNHAASGIDLVITDHLMPGMNGAAFVTELRKHSPLLPVLVISGLEEAEEEYAGLNVLFRLKPLLPDNLLASVHSLIPAHP